MRRGVPVSQVSGQGEGNPGACAGACAEPSGYQEITAPGRARGLTQARLRGVQGAVNGPQCRAFCRGTKRALSRRIFPPRAPPHHLLQPARGKRRRTRRFEAKLPLRVRCSFYSGRNRGAASLPVSNKAGWGGNADPARVEGSGWAPVVTSASWAIVCV